MWEVDYKESRTLKNRCFPTVVLEKTLESPLDCKGIKPVIPKGSQSWIFLGRTDAEAESPIFWPLDVKSWLTEKDPDAGKDWGQERRGDRGWDGWMASSTQWTWVWANSGRWWRIGKPGVLQSMGSQRVGRCLATEQQQQSSKVPTATNGKSVSIGHFQRNSWTSTSSILPNYCILVQYVQWILPQHNTDVLPYCS